MRFMPGCTTPRGRGRPAGTTPGPRTTRTRTLTSTSSTGSTRTRALVALSVVLGALALVAPAANAAVPAQPFVSGATFPFNGVWLESQDGGHYWDASGDGLCRVDADATSPSGFTQNAATCDVQAKKPTQAVVGPKNADGTYFVYAADMSSKSGGPLRLTYEPTAGGGAGAVGPGRAQALRGRGNRR